jgi:hypothetical protein
LALVRFQKGSGDYLGGRGDGSQDRKAMKITLSAAGALIAAAIALAIGLTNYWTTVAAGNDLTAVFRLDGGTAGEAAYRPDRWTDSVVECGYEGKDDPPVRAGLRRCVYK